MLRTDRRIRFRSLVIGIAVGLGVVLPLAFFQQLRSFALHQGAGQIALLYFISGAAYLLTALAASALVELVGLTSGRCRVRLDQWLSGVWLAYLAVSFGYFLSEWLNSLIGPIDPIVRYSLWTLGAALACGLMLKAIRSQRDPESGRNGVADWLRGLSQLGLLLLAVAAIIAAYQSIRFSKDGGAAPTEQASCPSSPNRRPNIFLISVDTLAAKDMSLYGYPRDTTPEISALANASFVFNRAYSPSNFTTPGIASLLTGVRPWTHRVYHLYGMPRQEALETSLPRLLRSCGYVTAAFISNGLAHPRAHGVSADFDYLPGNYLKYAREFVRDRLTISGAFSGQSLIDLYPLRQFVDVIDGLRSRLQPDWLPYSPDSQREDAVRFVANHEHPGRPIFVWTHFYPPHHFYLPPAPFLGLYEGTSAFSTVASQDFDYGYYPERRQPQIDVLRARYNENIRWADSSVGRYLAQLDRLGILDGAVVVLTSDHGESFTHGYWGHLGPYLHEDLVRIPLVVKMPYQRHGKRIFEVAELIDVMPTILDIAGSPMPQGIEGKSLIPAMTNRPRLDHCAVIMQLDASSALGATTAGTIAMACSRYKLVRHVHLGPAGDELFDLSEDPTESRSIAFEQPTRLAAMQQVLNDVTGPKLTANSERAMGKPR